MCDDGVNDGSYGHCLPGCVGPGPGCGDGEVNGPEACDDGNNAGDDECNADCVLPGTLLWTRNYTGEDAGNARARGAAVDALAAARGHHDADGASRQPGGNMGADEAGTADDKYA